MAKRSETARARDGKAAADIERMQAAQDLGLPVDQQGKVHYPDVQIEYTDADGRTDHVHVEVATNDYRNRSIQAKAAAGFVIHGNGRGAARGHLGEGLRGAPVDTHVSSPGHVGMGVGIRRAVILGIHRL